jgi:NADH-quinone oxidoreductase subunit N
MISYQVSAHDIASILPELLLAAGGALILLLDAFLPALRRAWTPLAVLVCLGAARAVLELPDGESWQGLLTAGALPSAVSLVVLLATLLCLLSSDGYLRRERILAGEYHALLLWCACGLLFMLRATELLTIFVALELFSVCLYSLAGFHRRLAVASESAIKYFLMGAFVSAFLLYGIALLYGQTGTTYLTPLANELAGAAGTSPLTVIGLLLVIAALGFKMSLVPFHAWSPDTYQGAPSPFVGFLSVAPKAASAIVLIRVLMAIAGADMGPKWPQLIGILAAVSMLVGNLLALVQRDIKRMLAYSGIGHMGYLLIPMVAIGPDVSTPVLMYLLAYTLMNAGAFAVIGMLYARPGEQHLITELSGWGYRFPVLGVCLTVCMLSLGGIPPTAGFLGKYLIFTHAIQHGHLWLALVGIAASLVGVFYYLRVVYMLYMKDEVAAPQGLLLDGWGRLAAVFAAGATLALGIWPSGLLEWLAAAVEQLP